MVQAMELRLDVGILTASEEQQSEFDPPTEVALGRASPVPLKRQRVAAQAVLVVPRAVVERLAARLAAHYRRRPRHHGRGGRVHQEEEQVVHR